MTPNACVCGSTLTTIEAPYGECSACWIESIETGNGWTAMDESALLDALCLPQHPTHAPAPAACGDGSTESEIENHHVLAQPGAGDSVAASEAPAMRSPPTNTPTVPPTGEPVNTTTDRSTP